MKKLTICCCLILIVGCAPSKINLELTSLPVLLEHVELPPSPRQITNPDFRLLAKIKIDESGSVTQTILLNGSGDPHWDSLACNSIKKWKYMPAFNNEIPVSVWLVQKIKIQYENPHYLSLSKILCCSRDTAFIVYEKLKAGNNFGELAKKYSCDSSRITSGFLGKKDVLGYPQKITQILKRLDVDEYTKPIEYGKNFVIFKRNEN